MVRLSAKVWSIVAQGLVLCLAAFAGASGASAGDEKWSPTIVSTVAGSPAGELKGAPVRAKLPKYADPRFMPKQMYTRQSGMLPDGAWSSIVTGAVPEEEGHGGGEAAAPQPQGAAPASAAAPAAGEQAKPAGAEAPPQGAAAAGDGRPPREKPLQGLPPDASPAQQYCFNTADSAADARFQWQQKKIKEMEGELEKRAKVLEERSDEFKTWLARRDEFSRKAQDKLVAFYAKMKPDAAAQQIAAMDEEIAAALLMKLEPKVASLFLAEIEPQKAAKLAAIITGLAKVAATKKQKAANAAPPSGAPGAAPGGAQPASAPQQAPPQPGAPRS